MEKRESVRGIKHMKSHYKKVSFQQFCKMFEEQEPYRSMRINERTAALNEDYQELGGIIEPKKVKEVKE